jgi:hypothetical protein
MAEKRTIELEIQDNSKSLKQQYREAVKELQAVSEQYGNTSKEAAAAAQKAAELKDQIAFSKDLVEGFNPDAKFKAVEGAINGVLNGFQAFEGGLALVGVESDDLQKTMVRLQGVMALTQGINGVLEAGDAFDVLKTKIKDTAISQSLLTVATTVYNTVVGTTTGGMKALRIAMLSTGIGALVVGIGLLIANFDKVIALFQPIIDGFKAIGDFIGITDFAAEEKAKNDAKRTEEELKRMESVRKTREKNFNNEQSAYDREIKLQQALGKSTLELQKAKINASIKYQEVKKKELEQDIAAFKIAQQFLGALGESLIGEDIAKMEAKINELTNSIEDQKTELQILDIEAKKAATTTTTTTTTTSGGGGGGGGTQKTDIDITRRVEDEKLRIKDESRQKELDALDLQYKRKKEDAEKELKDDKDKLSKLAALNAQAVESKKVDEQRINDKYDKIEKDAATQAAEEKIKLQDEQWLALQNLKNSQQQQDLLDLQLAYDKEYELAGTNAELQKALTDKFNKDSAAINKKYRTEEEEKQKEKDKKEKERIKQLNEYRVKSVEDSLQIVSNLAELFAGKSVKQQKKAFQIQKAVNIATAVVDTYKAANTALASSPPPFNYIAMAAAITAGLVNVKKIASQQFNSSSSSGGAGGSNAPTAAPMTANFSTIGSSGINQLAQLQQTPTQAYVVSGEVTSAQALDRNRVQNATL